MRIFAKPTCSCSSHGECSIETSLPGQEASCDTHHTHGTQCGVADHDCESHGALHGHPRDGHHIEQGTHAQSSTTDHGEHSHDHFGHSHSHGTGLSPKEEALFLGVCAAFFFTVLVVEHFYAASVNTYLIQGLYLIPYVLCGYPILREGLELILKKDLFNEFTLMGTASLVAILLGQTAEAVGVMLFYRVGEHIQERAAGSSRKNIEKLLASKPTQARLVDNGIESMVAVEAVGVGQHIQVRAGEKIPLDGVIVSGLSEIDQSPLTGESLPLAVEEKDRVIGGSINLTGALIIAVESTFANSHMAKILNMVEEAAKRKSPTERFITRFARYYTPAVVFAALFVALVPPLVLAEANFSTWIYRALVLLVISCPCALLISIPLGYFGGIGAASRRGILVKGGNVFDDILKIKSVVFDKTGTLTHGKFSVSEIAPSNGVTEQEIVDAAVITEMGASHPIAQAIMDYAEKFHGPAVDALRKFDVTSQEKAGRGMTVTYNNDIYRAGTQKYLEEEGIAVEVNSKPGAIVYLSLNNRFLGSILVSDSIKKDSAHTIAQLKQRGLATIMLTGDREESATLVAEEIGIDSYRSGLLPDGKIEALQQMTSMDAALFVGDGINDAPILSMARVGVAMGEIGSEVAIEAADVVLLQDSPKLIEDVFDISRAVRNIVWQNIGFALGVKTIIMGFGIAGLSGLWEAIFADVGVALLAVLNSSRIVYLKKKE